MSHIQSILITATATAITMVGCYTIKKLTKHIKKLCKELDEAIKINITLQKEIDEMKEQYTLHENMFKDIEKTLEGIAYAIPYNNSRAWQHNIVQKKLATEMAKLDENGEPMDCGSDSE